MFIQLGLIQEERGIDIVVIDTRRKTDLFEFMIIVTGHTQRHLRTMAESVCSELRARDIHGELEPVVEGRDCEDWMALDGGNVVCHFFSAVS